MLHISPTPHASRNAQIDSLRALLIFLVVLGHLLECFSGTARSALYTAIYSFHMPAFVFCSGLFASFSYKRLLARLIYPYLIYQTLYTLFARSILHTNTRLQYTTPYWLLWYLFSLISWTLCIPLLNMLAHRPYAVLSASILISLAVGFVPAISYPFSLSRTLVLLPFFIFGYYFHNLPPASHLLRWGCTAVSIFVTALLALMQLPAAQLYHSKGYAAANSTPLLRLSLLCLGFAWIITLLSVLPQNPPAFVCRVGKYSVCIFLLHGFFARLPAVRLLFSQSESVNLSIAFALALALCLALGNRAVFRLLQYTFSAESLLDPYQRASGQR